MMENGVNSSGNVKLYPMMNTTLSGVTDVPRAAHYTVKQPDANAERDILVDVMNRYLTGWEIDFGAYASSWDLPGRQGTKATVKVSSQQLILGYGNVPGWVNFLAYKEPPLSGVYQRQHQLMIENFGYKMTYFQPHNVKQALCQLGSKVRGYVSWNINWDNDVKSANVTADPIDTSKYGDETSYEVVIEQTTCSAENAPVEMMI